MGLENMRRGPLFIVLAICIFLILLLWNMVGKQLQNENDELSKQLHDCSSQHASCREESLNLLEQNGGYMTKINELKKDKFRQNGDIQEYKIKLSKAETQVNRTLVHIDLCKTELQSLKNLQVSKSATLETLRLEKDTLTAQLDERKQRIGELEKEIDRLKTALTTKSAPNPPVSSKVTPAAQPLKLSPPLNNQNPLLELELDNDAKEEMEDANAINDGSDFDQQLK